MTKFHIDFWAGSAFLMLLGWGLDVQAGPSSPRWVERCTSGMRTSDGTFRTSTRFKVLIAAFDGLDEQSQKLGTWIAKRLQASLPDYARQATITGSQLSGTELETIYVPCVLEDHDQARQIGAVWGADVVFWGLASASGAPLPRLTGRLARLSSAPLQVNINNQGGTIISKRDFKVTIQWPKPKWPMLTGSYRTAITVVHLPGLQAHATKGVQVDPLAILDLDLAQLASEEPLALFRYVAGMAAFSKHRYDEAAAKLRDAAQPSPPVETNGQNGISMLPSGAGISEIEVAQFSKIANLQALSQILAGELHSGVMTLQSVLNGCALGDTRCQLISMLNLGWAYDHFGDEKRAASYYKQVAFRGEQIATEPQSPDDNVIRIAAAQAKDRIDDKEHHFSYNPQVSLLIEPNGSMQKNVDDDILQLATTQAKLWLAQRQTRPFYKSPCFWLAIGSSSVAVGLAIGIPLSLRGSDILHLPWIPLLPE